MAPRLKIDGPLGKGLKKVLTKRLEQADSCLSAAGDDLETAVHEARKEFKALRSVARMIRHLVGKSDYKRLNAHLRDASRELSSLRDAHALGDAIDLVIRESRAEAEEAERLRQAGGHAAASGAEADSGRVERAIAEARTLIEPLPDLVKGLDLPQGDPRSYIEGLAISYREARKALKQGFKTRDADDLHEARKRVINWRYQLDLVSPIWKPVLKPEVGELQALREHLGQHNDIAMLERALESDAEPWAGLQEREAWVERTRDLRERLVERSERAGALLFSEAPKRRAARLEALWQAARRD